MFENEWYYLQMHTDNRENNFENNIYCRKERRKSTNNLLFSKNSQKDHCFSVFGGVKLKKNNLTKGLIGSIIFLTCIC